MLHIVVVVPTVELLKQQADGKGMTICIDSFTARSLHEIIHFTTTTRRSARRGHCVGSVQESGPVSK
jgi:hypothetical protein